MVLPLTALGLALALALPGLCSRRFGPWVLRAVTLLVLGAIGAIALDWPAEEKVLDQPTLAVVAAGAIDDSTRAALQVQLGATPWRLVEAGARAGAAAAALAIARADPRVETTLLWVEPIVDATVPAGRAAPVFTARVPLPFEIDALRVRALTPAVRGRPFAAELELPPGLAGVGELRLATREGASVASQPIDAARPPQVRLDLAQPTAGEHRLDLSLRAGDVEVTAQGSFEVAEGGRVVAVGALAEPLARALAVQGFRVEAVGALPGALDGVDVLILTARVAAEEAPRVREFVLDGGGLFLLGAPDGGSVPIEGEDLAPLSPVVLAARPAPTARAGVRPGESAGPTPPPTDVTPTGRPPQPATGDTAGAQPQPPGPPQEIERRSVAMVLVVDRSASMAELVGSDAGLRRTRMDYVRSSAEATIRRLWPGDLLAIVSFGNPNSDEVVLPLTGAEDLGGAYRALGQLQARPNEGTYLESALARAGTILAQVSAPVKHVVVITDGVIADLRPTSTLRAQRLREAGVTVSLIRFGAETPDTMHFAVDCRKFAQLGGGQYVFSTRTTEVPALVSDEVRRVFVASGRVDPNLVPAPTTGETPSPGRPTDPPTPDSPPPPAVADPPSPAPLAVRALAPSPLLEPVPAAGLPSVAGVLPVAARTDAHTLLVAGAEGFPLLAFANRGLGRVGVFTSGLEAEWGAAWLEAPEFPGWFARWIASIAPAQAEVEAVDLFAAKQAAPRGPTPRELHGLATWSGREVRGLDALRPAAARTTTRWHGTAIALSIAAAASILALAALEFFLVRR